MSEIIPALKRFINTEADEQLKQVQSMWGETIEQRVAEGEAISGLQPIDIKHNRAIFRFERNLSKFRVGERVRLNSGDPFEEPYFSCILTAESDDTITLAPGYRETFHRLSREKWVLDREAIDTRHIMLGVLNQLDDDRDTLDYFVSLLHGGYAPEIPVAVYRSALQTAQQIGMNSAQAEGFANAFATQNYYLIQGPPGTGKTWVLAYLAAALAQHGQRVLVTAFTHRAINNALRKIAETTHYPRVFKIGQSTSAEDLGPVQNYEDFENTGMQPTSRGFIAGATCYAIRGKRLGDVEFDTVIFDEAGQVTLPLAFAGMLAGERHIFIGDHQQMPPVIVAKHKEDWVSKSIFELLHAKVSSTMLDTTYRMNEAINDFPSRAFYGGRLKTAASNRDQKLELTHRPRNILDTLLNPDRPNIFAIIPHKGRGMRSPEEAIVAANLIAEALNCGVPGHEIAVVTPYRAQVRLIRNLLAKVSINDPRANDVVIDTVERIQGQERDLVIISLATSDPAHAVHKAEFYFIPNRINVAITRPRRKRIILGSRLLFQAQTEDPRHQQWIQLFKSLYETSHKVSVTPDHIRYLANAHHEVATNS